MILKRKQSISIKKITPTSLIFLIGILLSGCFTTLKTPEIKGVVLDAETGKPIEGARIYAKWQKIVSGPGGQTSGGIAKELRLKTKEDGTFVISPYRLVNFIPHPFGQGGAFYMIVYAHDYKYKSFSFHEIENFDNPKYEEFQKKLTENKLMLKLAKIKNPESFIENRGDIYSYVDVDQDYIFEEDKLFVEKFGKQKWNKNIQYELAEAYYRIGDYKSAMKKLKEIIEDNPNAKTKYFDEKYQKYKSKLKESNS
jgi:tetratricopeptide (TPR) repeat protein